MMSKFNPFWSRLCYWSLPVLVMLVSVFATSYLVVLTSFPTAALMVLPISFVGWKYGRWAGMIAGAMTSTGLYEFISLLDGPVGGFMVRGFGPGFFGLSAMGFLIGYTTEQARVARRAVRVAELSRDLMGLVASDLPFDQTLEALTLRIEQELNHARCAILSLDREKGTLHPRAAPNLPLEYRQAIDGIAIGPSAGTCGTAAFRNELVVVENIQQNPLCAEFAELCQKHHLAACWSIPISNSQGDCVGIFSAYYDHPRSPADWELEIVGKASAHAQLAMARQHDRERRLQLEAQVQTAQKLEGLGLLAGGIAHDFNNMLAIVLGNAELLSMDLQDEDSRNRAASITDAANRAADLAKQMLIYAGKANQQLVEVEISGMVSELQSLAVAGMPKTIRIDLDLAENLPTFTADETQLRQILMNLIGNAAEAIGDDKVGTISIRTRCEYVTRDTLDQSLLGKDLPAGMYIRLEVEDDGEGIPEKLQKHIFDPFFSTKFTGRGLGLAVIFGVIMRHKGSITLTSEVGKGTCFTILLPVTGQKADPIPGENLSVLKSIGSGVALVIDDEPSVRNIARQYLSKLGFEVIHEADGGRTGVQAFHKLSDSLSLVLIDLTMPDINGHEVLREIEKLPSEANFVLMTGYDVTNVLEDSESMLNPILHKPFDLKSLSNAIAASQVVQKFTGTG
ncbi:MAG: response regulator [Gammaproteobacteria bacterium]|nr:response regulator [Gammaproteobacteria bacterium]